MEKPWGRGWYPSLPFLFSQIWQLKLNVKMTHAQPGYQNVTRCKKKDYIHLGDHISPTAQKRSVWALRFIFIICLYFPGASRPSTTLKPTLSTGSTLMSRIARGSRDPVTPAPSSSPSQSKTNSLTTPSKRRLPRGKHDLIANLRFPLYDGPPFRVKGHTKKKLA